MNRIMLPLLITEQSWDFLPVILFADGKWAVWNKVRRSNKEPLCLIPVECAETAALCCFTPAAALSVARSHISLEDLDGLLVWDGLMTLWTVRFQPN